MEVIMFIVYGTKIIESKKKLLLKGECSICHKKLNLSSFVGYKWFTLFLVPIFPIQKIFAYNYCNNCKKLSYTSFRKWKKNNIKKIDYEIDQLNKEVNMDTLLHIYESTLIINDLNRIKRIESFIEKNLLIDIDKAAIISSWYNNHQLFTKSKPIVINNIKRNSDKSINIMNILMNESFNYEELIQLNLPKIIKNNHWENKDVINAYVNRIMELGEISENGDYIKKIYEMDVDNEMANVSYVKYCLLNNQYNEAYKVVMSKKKIFLYELNTLLKISKYYMESRQYKEAYDVYEILLQTRRNHNNKEIIINVKKIEKELAISKSSIRFNDNKTAIILGAIGVVVIWPVIIFGSTYYLKNNQKLYVSNMLPVEINVILDGKNISIPSRMFEIVNLKEGRHYINIKSETNNSEDTFEITNTFFDRYFGKKMFIYNTFKSGIIYWQKGVYTNNENYDAGETLKIYINESFLSFKNISYKFKELPDSMSVEGSEVKEVEAINILFYEGEEQMENLRKIGVNENSIIQYQKNINSLQ
jgi:hypothetical protein